MSETVMSTNALPSFLVAVLKTDKVRVREDNRVVTIVSASDECDCTVGLRGMFAGDPNMTVDKFLERKRADKELDL